MSEGHEIIGGGPDTITWWHKDREVVHVWHFDPDAPRVPVGYDYLGTLTDGTKVVLLEDAQPWEMPVLDLADYIETRFEDLDAEELETELREAYGVSSEGVIAEILRIHAELFGEAR